ncbi:MAG: single-stranded DNA-binding protein [Acidimicrobiia bacterium]|nr:single-stranded DNA-binding protein [Acidimicrobiia bacterium]
MATGNNVTVVGNVTRDPELRFTASGQAKANFGIAVNRRWQNRQTQEWEEATSFFNVVCWGDMGENVGESLQKGARVLVTGRLEQRSWESDNGEKRSIVEIVADEVGPSLRWATAEIKKNDRRGPGDGGGGSSRPVANEPVEASAGAGGGGYDYGEEPF